MGFFYAPQPCAHRYQFNVRFGQLGLCVGGEEHGGGGGGVGEWSISGAETAAHDDDDDDDKGEEIVEDDVWRRTVEKRHWHI